MVDLFLTIRDKLKLSLVIYETMQSLHRNQICCFQYFFCGPNWFLLAYFCRACLRNISNSPKGAKDQIPLKQQLGVVGLMEGSWIYRQRKGCVNLQRNIKEWKNILCSHNGHYISVTIGHSLGSFEPDRKWSWWESEPNRESLPWLWCQPVQPSTTCTLSWHGIIWYNMVWCGAVGQKLFYFLYFINFWQSLIYQLHLSDWILE